MEYITVVYKINDRDVFNKEVYTGIKESFLIEGETDYSVIALSSSDEVSRMELIEEALWDNDVDLAKEIIQAVSVEGYE